MLTIAFLARPTVAAIEPATAGVRTAAAENNPLAFAKWTRKTLLDESASIPQMINVYQLLVRHPDLFYPFRELYVPHIVGSLTKLSAPGVGTGNEARILTLDVIELVLKWEKTRALNDDKVRAVEDGKMDVDAPTPAPAPTPEEVEKSPRRARPDRAVSMAPSTTSNGLAATTNWAVPLPQRDQVVNNLLRFIAQSTEAISRNNIVARALALLKELIGPGVWSETNIKLAFFSRQFTISEVGEDTLVALCNSAEVLVVVASYKPADWVIANLAARASLAFLEAVQQLTRDLQCTRSSRRASRVPRRGCTSRCDRCSNASLMRSRPGRARSPRTRPPRSRRSSSGPRSRSTTACARWRACLGR